MGSTISQYKHGKDVNKSYSKCAVKYEKPNMFIKIINSSFDTIRFDYECYEVANSYSRNLFIDQILTSIGPDLYELYIRSMQNELYSFTGGTESRILGRSYSSRHIATHSFTIGRSINTLLNDIPNFEYTLGLVGNKVLVDLHPMTFEKYITKVLKGENPSREIKRVYDLVLKALHYLVFNLDISHYSLTLDKISIVESADDVIPIIKDFSTARKGSFLAYDAYSLLRSLVETTEWFNWYGDELKLFYTDISIEGNIPDYFVGDRRYSTEGRFREDEKIDENEQKDYTKYLEGNSSMLTILHLPQIKLFSPSSYSKFERSFNYGRSIKITMEYITLLNRLNIDVNSRLLIIENLIMKSTLALKTTKNRDGYDVLGKTELLQISRKGVMSLKDSITFHEPNRYRSLVKMKNPTNSDIDAWITDPWIRINLFIAYIESEKGGITYISPYIEEYTSYVSNELILTYYENLKDAVITGKLGELIRASVGGLIMNRVDANFAVESLLPNSYIDKVPAYGNCYFCSLARHINKNQSSVREDIAIYLERLRDRDADEYKRVVNSFLVECPSEEGNYRDQQEDESFLKMFPDYVRKTCKYGNVDCRDCILGGDVYDKIISFIYDLPIVSISVGFLVRFESEAVIEHELVKIIAQEAGISENGNMISVEDNRLTILFGIKAPYDIDNYKGQIISYLFNIKGGHIDFIEL
uniref:Uncharacterized protein n=1 Tax=Pithovirus LCPAC401 TaxID=2506595 RepID=A0A481ZAN7_9VIRU|nr:MAG: uncharacterized protein LCPAC401_01730 [Pithovirus LCPAC401]